MAVTRRSGGYALLFAVVLGLACGTEPSADEPYRIDILAEDQFGAPVDSAALAVYTWRSTGGGLLDWSVRSDSRGRASVVDRLGPSGAPDSILIVSGVEHCAGLRPYRNTVVPARTSVGVSITLALPRVPRARLAPARYCGIGAQEIFETFYVNLTIDSVAAAVYGTWSIAYRATRRTEDGPFVGEQIGDSLYLDLVPDGDDAPCNSRYLLVAPMGGDTIGRSHVVAVGGCFASAMPFDLFLNDTPFYPRFTIER